MASCPKRDFKDPKDMLWHLRDCAFLPQGKFWCPTCGHEESFKVVSKTKCSWDKVTIARKLYQKSVKAFQRISGHHEKPHRHCSCVDPHNGPFGFSQVLASEPPIKSTPFNVQLHHVEVEEAQVEIEEAAAGTLRWELPSTEKVLELYGARQSSFMANEKIFSRPSCDKAPIPEPPNHQKSPSELSPASSDRSGYSSDVSPTSATLTNESPVLGHPPENIITSIPTFPIARQASQAGGRGEVPPLTVKTDQSVGNMTASEWGFMLLGGDGALHPSLDIDGVFAPELVSITPPQTNEGRPLDTSYAFNEPLVPQGNTHLHPSPALSVPSYSTYELSASPMSSGPEQLQCPYADCDFRPTGKIENQDAYMRKHVKTHLGNTIPCEYCHKPFTRQDNLTNHIRKIHGDNNDSPSKRRRSSYESLRSAGQPRRKESRRQA
ncbi:hypothetical protein F5X98DRAFT_185646 [Xylaria grammica]|nr:hypothetical protein F5X98DRAFT_185646 [Xylaria grammica]